MNNNTADSNSFQVSYRKKRSSSEYTDVLVVDDQFAIGQLLVVCFRSSNLKVRAVSDPREAMVWYQQNKDRVGIVLLDLEMPYLDGRRCFELIRKANRKQIIAVMSGNPHHQDITTLLENGASTFFGKPIDIVSLTRWTLGELSQEKELRSGKSLQSDASLLPMMTVVKDSRSQFTIKI
jgi:DNA-binding response OmpR family regulator